ncbi:NPC intracellular cholesterol transporter 2 [Pseudolycoriella hygida]|uniref:NPC intracellular cholesterol transporter 2 n=1 Tax=Pseudolycoriella hygida TaxID=35572 RepID=A0A9Q0MY24_9DIPT|nr:NPC intracellular cholesterol transporter 2 [Pseudolycoriella hygida]
MYTQIFFMFLLATTATALVGWRDCGSQMGSIYTVRMTNCTQTPCLFHRGQSYEAEADGRWRANSNTLPFVLFVIVLGAPIPLLEGDACDYKIRGICPARNTDTFTFASYYPVPTNLPPVGGVARAQMYNDFGDTALCFELDVRIA